MFAANAQQRELAFPASLSPLDRYKIHVMAEVMAEAALLGSDFSRQPLLSAGTHVALVRLLCLGATHGDPRCNPPPLHSRGVLRYSHLRVVIPEGMLAACRPGG